MTPAVRKGRGVERKPALQRIDDRSIGAVEFVHQLSLPLAASSGLEKTAPRCLKQRVENSTA